MRQWEAASSRTDTFVIGDTNLDYKKWNSPDTDHVTMTDLVKSRIETLGFHQTVEGDTRYWPHAENSLLDQCWTNCPARIVSATNRTRGSSDHNILVTNIRVAGSINNPKEILLRDKRYLDWDIIKSEAEAIDWTELLETENLDLANNIFENKIRGILDSRASVISRKIKVKNKIWICNESKDQLNLRDRAREKASQSQLDTDWEEYRRTEKQVHKTNKR